MELIELEQADKPRYNDFVARNQNDAFLQSWEWGDWQIHLDKTVRRFALTEEGQLFSAGQFIKLPPHRSPVWYAPRGPVLAASSLKSLDAFITHLRPKLSAALAIRIEPEVPLEGLSAFAKRTLPSQPERTATLDLQQSLDELLGRMHEKTRYNIRLAEKKGVVVTKTSAQHITPEQINNCISLLQRTADRQQFRNHPDSYLRKFFDYFKSLSEQSDLKVSVYFASYENALLTTAVMIDFGRTRIYLYGGSSEAHRNVMAPYLLHWTAISDAKEKNLSWYDLGGSETVGGKEAGFTRFKSGFRGSEITYAGTWDIPLKSVAYPLYALGRKLNRIKNHIL